ncbi:MAG: hypothetical protein DI551_02465 [Micavibrio aeruginosavorus]|uniref:Uncharacterized protein n=1 Tax=Micavibrio aeruginosavorus TaxID=349221 RepID=A0A2W5N386_9BACT|nr:MAG: hypothetical protein DI551_02465 [Micavibrio aeruginosavorus]
MKRFEKDERILVAETPFELRAFRKHYNKDTPDITGIICPYTLFNEQDGAEFEQALLKRMGLKDPFCIAVDLKQDTSLPHAKKAVSKLKRVFEHITSHTPSNILVEVNSSLVTIPHPHEGVTYAWRRDSTMGVDIAGKAYAFPERHIVAFNRMMDHKSPNLGFDQRDPRINFLMS